MDLRWNPFSRGGLYMSAPSLVERLRGQQCPISRQFFTVLALCHTVMAEWKEGEVVWDILCDILWMGSLLIFDDASDGVKKSYFLSAKPKVSLLLDKSHTSYHNLPSHQPSVLFA